jgi:hypothetical protein
LLVDGHSAPLGARAFDLLLALVERRERTVTKNELLDLVWPGLVVEENNLQVQISTLRKVLGQDACSNPGQDTASRCRPGRPSPQCPRLRRPTTHSHPVVEAPAPVAPADAKGQRRRRNPLGRRPGVPQGNCDGQRSCSSGHFSSCWRRCHGITETRMQTADDRYFRQRASVVLDAILPFAAPGGRRMRSLPTA